MSIEQDRYSPVLQGYELLGFTSTTWDNIRRTEPYETLMVAQHINTALYISIFRLSKLLRERFPVMTTGCFPSTAIIGAIASQGQIYAYIQS